MSADARFTSAYTSCCLFSTETAQSVKDKSFVNLTPLTPGMHGYSLLRPGLNQEYYHDLYEKSLEFGIPIEGHHTETGEPIWGLLFPLLPSLADVHTLTGPGVYETALEYKNALRMADNAIL